jgi:hypothetical protein
VFLTAFSLDEEDVSSFKRKLEQAVKKGTDGLVQIRLWRDEKKDGKVILLAYYAYDNEETDQILGELYFVEELIEVAIDKVARSLGYKTKRRTHSADVVASERTAALPAPRPLTGQEEIENWLRDNVQAAGPRGALKSGLTRQAKRLGYDRRLVLGALQELEDEDYLKIEGNRVIWTFNPPWER